MWNTGCMRHLGGSSNYTILGVKCGTLDADFLDDTIGTIISFIEFHVALVFDGVLPIGL